MDSSLTYKERRERREREREREREEVYRNLRGLTPSARDGLTNIFSSIAFCVGECVYYSRRPWGF